MNIFSIINCKSILVFILMGGFLVSVVIDLLNISLPKQLIVYLIVLSMIIIMALKNGIIYLRYPPQSSILLFGFFFALIIFYTYTSSSSLAAKDKILFFTYMSVTPIGIATLINYEAVIEKYIQFLSLLRNFCIFTLIVYFLLFNLGFYEHFLGSQRLYLIGTGNPIWFSRNVAFMLFAILFAEKVTDKKTGVITVFCILISFFLLLCSGSRAPVLAIVFTWGFFSFRYSSLKINIICISLLASSLVIFFYVLHQNRIFTLELYSINERLFLYSEAFSYIKNNIWGHGIGSFGLLTTGEDVRAYPHNIFIEILFEMGFIGFGSFLSLIYICLKSYEKNNIFFYLFLLALINAQSSGDLASNNYIFIFMYLSVVYKKYSKNMPLRVVQI